MKLLSGKNIIITGASRGFGRLLAHKFWEQGANLILVARSIENLIELKDQLKSASLNQIVEIFAHDLSNLNTIPELMKKIYQDFPQVDVLINNAAIQGPIGPSWEVEWSEWQETLALDLLVPVILTRACLPVMIQQTSGKIINLSGGGATNARPNFSAYAVAKAALVRFTETLAAEVEAYAIDINCVAPGVMNTDMLNSIVQVGEAKAGEKEYKIAQAKAEDSSSMEQALALCTFLASDASNGISGKLISAIWDPWSDLTQHLDELKQSDIYTLRRIVPEDRGKQWSKV